MFASDVYQADSQMISSISRRSMKSKAASNDSVLSYGDDNKAGLRRKGMSGAELRHKKSTHSRCLVGCAQGDHTGHSLTVLAFKDCCPPRQDQPWAMLQGHDCCSHPDSVQGLRSHVIRNGYYSWCPDSTFFHCIVNHCFPSSFFLSSVLPSFWIIWDWEIHFSGIIVNVESVFSLVFWFIL